MKVANRATRENHVHVSVDATQSVEFRQYLALSRDSYPMGLGRIVAVCLHVLAVGRRQFSSYELDRIVQWPADRPLGFAATLETIGWARALSRTVYLLELPPTFIPRVPYRDRTREVGIRDTDGRMISHEQHEKILLTQSGIQVLTVDMDGVARVELDSIKVEPKQAKARRRHKHGKSQPIGD